MHSPSDAGIDSGSGIHPLLSPRRIKKLGFGENCLHLLSSSRHIRIVFCCLLASWLIPHLRSMSSKIHPLLWHSFVIRGKTLFCKIFLSRAISSKVELTNKRIYFDYNLGVSSGTANLITYVAKQRGRTYRFYHDYSFHRKYFSVTNFITNRGSLLGLDYIYSEICNSDGIDPLDYEAIEKADCIYKAAATVAKTGKVHYFDKSDFKKDDYTVLKACCALPAASRSVKFNGVRYFDGGVANPVPYKKAFEDGCDKIVVVLYYPKDYRKPPMSSLAKILLAKYPEVVKGTMTTNERYNADVDALIELEKQGKLFVIRPQEPVKVKRMEKDVQKLKELYEIGRKIGEEMLRPMTEYLGS